jgi:hypothetical protein
MAHKHAHKPFNVDHSRHQEQRRNAFIARSKDARASAIDKARQAAVQQPESDSDMVRSLTCSACHSHASTVCLWTTCINLRVMRHHTVTFIAQCAQLKHWGRF